MDEVVTASPGEDSPLHTEADTVYLPVTVSGGNAEVIAGSDTGEALQMIHEDLLQTNQYLSEQADTLAEQLAVSQDQTVKIQENTLMISICLGIIAGMLIMLGLWNGRK